MAIQLQITVETTDLNDNPNPNVELKEKNCNYTEAQKSINNSIYHSAAKYSH